MVSTACAVLTLTGLVFLTLPRAYEHEATEHLRGRALLLADGVGRLVERGYLGTDPEDLAEGTRWLEADQDFRHVALFDEGGGLIATWPGASPFWKPEKRTKRHVVVEEGGYVQAFVPLEGEGSVRLVGVRVSTDRVEVGLANVRWMFQTVFLFGAVIFAALTAYLVRGVAHPIRDIHDAARRIVNGERDVRMPISGDRELDELSNFVSSLVDRRTVTPAPGQLRTRPDLERVAAEGKRA